MDLTALIFFWIAFYCIIKKSTSYAANKFYVMNYLDIPPDHVGDYIKNNRYKCRRPFVPLLLVFRFKNNHFPFQTLKSIIIL